MTRQAFFTDKVVELPAPLSNAVRTGNLLFVSGVTPYDLDRKVVPGDFKAQMLRVMESAKIIMAEAGTSLDRVVKATLMLADIRYFQEAYEVWREYFDAPYPALTTLECGFARSEFMVEIEFITEID